MTKILKALGIIEETQEAQLQEVQVSQLFEGEAFFYPVYGKIYSANDFYFDGTVLGSSERRWVHRLSNETLFDSDTVVVLS